MRVILFLGILLLGQIAAAQDTAYYRQQVEYSDEFVFSEGFYLSFKDFRDNDPVPTESIVSKYDKNSESFLKDVLDEDAVSYTGLDKQTYKIPLDKVWGYSHNGNIFVNVQNTFNRVPIIGRISHFVATVTTYVTTPNMGNPYYGYGQNGMMRVPTTELKQLIIDYETGKIQDFTVETLENILLRDRKLLAEFIEIPNRKKKDMLFIFMRKYNEAHPVSFPE